MDGISEVLQFAVIVQWGWSSRVEVQLCQKLHLLCGDVPPWGRIVEKLFQPWLDDLQRARLLFNKLESFGPCARQSAAQNNLQAKCLQVDIPGVDHRIQEGDAVFDRDTEDIRVQKFENSDPHLFIAAVAKLSHLPEPLFTSQFLPSTRLSNIQQFLRNQAFELAKGLLLKNLLYFIPLVADALAEDQFPELLERRPGGSAIFFPQSLPALQIGQLRQSRVPAHSIDF